MRPARSQSAFIDRLAANRASLTVLSVAVCLGAAGLLMLRSQSPKAATIHVAAARPAMLVPVSLAEVIDDRALFRQIFCALDRAHGGQFPVRRSCNEALNRIGGEGQTSASGVATQRPTGTHLHIVIVPGMFGQCVKSSAAPLQDAAAYMRSQGYPVDTIDVGGRSSSAGNATIIARAVRQLLRPGERLLIIGYSKGMSDILETLALYPQAIPRGSAVVSLAGIVSGTPLADHPAELDGIVSRLPLSGCSAGDSGAVESVSRQRRIAWLADHPLPSDRTYFSIAAFTDDEHMSSPLKETRKLLSKIDVRNDGQVLYTDAILPGSHLLGYVNADHWAIALPFARNVPALRPLFAGNNDYPREILLEAIVRSVEEQLASADTAQSRR